MTQRSGRMLPAGHAEMHSPLFADTWLLECQGRTLAGCRRDRRRRVARVALPDGTEWRLEPDGWGVVRLLEDEVTSARATRRNFLGRTWDISGVGFAYELRQVPTVARHWQVRLGSEPVVDFRGALITYNRIRIDAAIPIYLAAVALAWQIMTRPWEASARPALTGLRRVSEAPGILPP